MKSQAEELAEAIAQAFKAHHQKHGGNGHRRDLEQLVELLRAGLKESG